MPSAKCAFVFSSSGIFNSAIHMLRNTGDIHPSYWIRHKRDDPNETESFEWIEHDVIDAARCDFPDELGDYGIIDAKLLSELADIEAAVLKMMDRLDIGHATGNYFDYNDRARMWHYVLRRCVGVIEQLKFDVAIFEVQPHFVVSYVFYRLFEHYDIPVIIFAKTHLPDHFYIEQTLGGGPKLAGDQENIPSWVSDYISSVQSEKLTAEPDHMRQKGERNHPARVLRSNLRHGLQLLMNPTELFASQETYLKSGSTLKQSDMCVFEYNMYMLRARKYRRKLQHVYGQLSRSEGLNEKYLYFPLHYQPEQTTSPMGGRYVDQYLAVRLLAQSIDAGTSVYCKEHPSQFDAYLHGDKGRPPWYYSELDSLENVRLIPVESDSFELIDNAVAVATVTGTAGWEAVIRGTPALVFGDPWYADAPGCFNSKTRDELESALNVINRGANMPTDEQIAEYISKLAEGGYFWTDPSEEGEADTEARAKMVAEVIQDTMA